jgi:hypothetical protein
LAHVVHDTVLGALRRALAGTTGRSDATDTTPVATALRTYTLRTPTQSSPLFGDARGGGGGWSSAAAGAATVAESTAPAAAGVPATSAALPYASLRFVGQVFRGYLVCEGTDRVVS